MQKEFTHTWLGAEFDCVATFEKVPAGNAPSIAEGGSAWDCVDIEICGPDGYDVTDQIRKLKVTCNKKVGEKTEYGAIAEFTCAADDMVNS